MIEGMCPREELVGVARSKRRLDDEISRPIAHVSTYLDDGWTIKRMGKSTVRLQRPKTPDVVLEDRVWTLLYRMGFTHLSRQLSSERGAKLVHGGKGQDAIANQLDVVGLEPDIALAVECKTAAKPRSYSGFQNDLGKFELLRQPFARSVHAQFALEEHKRVPVLAFFTENLDVSSQDRQRASDHKVALFDEHDLDYYEKLVTHLGPAAKYQLFADMLPHRKGIPGLRASIPAIRAKMGSYTCYTFSVRPDYLLKIAYVSHRAKGKAMDVDTYQRMVKRSRLTSIRHYLDENGIFPTNIVVSLDGDRVCRFDLGKLEGPHEIAAGSGDYGTLHLAPGFRSAWIIDGQHRLFAYSGHPRASTSYLNVLAFEKLPASEQAKLFIDINSEQKRVKRSLLQELYAELHWNADDDDVLVRAIASKAIQALNRDTDSPLCGRILLADDRRTEARCISLEAMYRALTKPGMFVVKPGVQYGPMWAGTREESLGRTIRIVKAWFNQVTTGAGDWWALGSAPGGGLAMNDGVTVCVEVLRSVFQHLTGCGLQLVTLAEEEVVREVRPFGEALGEYLGDLTEHEKAVFRRFRGVQGQTEARIMCEMALHARFESFCPPKLEERIELQKANTNQTAYASLQEIETLLHRLVMETVRGEYGDEWWYRAVPKQVRLIVNERRDEDEGRGALKDYFDLVHLKKIVTQNWLLFQSSLGRGKGSKDRQTEWIDSVNEIRKVVMHPLKSTAVSWEQLAELRDTEAWIRAIVKEPSADDRPNEEVSS